MNKIILLADINECIITGWRKNTGEVNARELKVEMCDELSGCAEQIVTFELADGTVHESKVINGVAEIPIIDEPQHIKIGLYTLDFDGDKLFKRYSPKPAHVYVNMGSYKEGASNPPIPTLGTYAELLKKINSISNPNYNQNDPTQKDYIKNRPFYKEDVEVDYLILPYVETENEVVVIGNKIGLEAGKDYTIDIYDDSELVDSITIQGIDASAVYGISAIVLGDIQTLPFMIADGALLDDKGKPYQADNAFYFLENNYSKIVIHGIPSVQTIYHTLPIEYLSPIPTDLIVNGAVTKDKMAQNSVGQDNIEKHSITNSKVADEAISTEKIIDGAVTTEKIADNAITKDKISDSAVTGNKILDNTITTSKLANSSVTNDKIASDISHLKLSEPIIQSECVVTETEPISVFSETISLNARKAGQKIVIYGTIVSSDTESTEQQLKLQGRSGEMLTLASVTADFSSSKQWNLWCEIERYNTEAHRIEMFLSTENGEQINAISFYKLVSSFIQIRLLFGDSTTHQMAYGTNLKLCIYE